MLLIHYFSFSSSSSLETRIMSVTSTIPLTTIYTLAQTCKFGAVKTWSVAHQTNLDNGAKPTLFAQPRDLHDCRPSGYGTKGQIPFYSPGVCPSGYYAAVPSNAPSPATSYCCPLGASFPYEVDGPSYCYSTITANWIDVPGSPSSSSAAGGSILVSLIEIIDGTPFSSTVVVGIQEPLAVTWQSSDLAQFAPASAPLNNVAVSHFSAPGGSASSVATQTGYSQPSGSSTSSSGLSTGAEAGIGVGVAVVVLALLGGLTWWFLRRRRAKRQSGASSMPLHDYQAVPNGQATAPHNQLGSRAELGGAGVVSEMDGRGTQPNELDSTHKPVEVGDTTEKFELPGDYGAHEK